MTPADALLLAAFDLATAGRHPFTVSDLAVAAWVRCPQSYGMPGYKAVYPDKQRVAGDLARSSGSQSLVRRGFLARDPAGGYALTAHGRREAERLLAPPPAPARPPRYEVLTWSVRRGCFTPQIGVRRGPYTLFGLRAAIRKLRSLYGYEATRTDNSVLVQRIPEKVAAARDLAAKETA